MSNINKILNKDLYEKFHKKTSLIKQFPHSKNFTYGTVLSQIDYIVKNRRNLNVLDLGCGAGSIAFYLINKGHNVTGVDISESAIRSCRETKKFHKLKKSRFIRKSAEEYLASENAKKYDIVIMSELIEHLKNDQTILIKVRGILRKDGAVFITVPSVNAPLYKMGALKKFDKRVGHLRRYSEKSLSVKVKKSGYKIISIKKTEGILRNAVFNINGFGIIVRIMNKFYILGKIFSQFDNLSCRLLGESDIQLVAINK